MSNEVKKFPFDGAVFPVIQTDQLPSGEGIAVATVSKHLGIDPVGQRQAIERRPWSEGRKCVLHFRLPGDTQRRQVFLLDTDRFAMWMATIDTSRLKNEDAKQRIIKWQNEAADALNTYLREDVVVRPSSTKTDDEIRAAVERQLEMREYKVVIRDTIGSFDNGDRWMFADIRDRFLYHVSGLTAGQLRTSGREIRTWTGKTGPTKRDLEVGTNYLTPEELKEFNMLLDYVAIEVRRSEPRTFDQLIAACEKAVQRKEL